MSRIGVVGPLHLNLKEATVAAEIIRSRIEGVALEGTPVELLPSFSRKLLAAVKRKRKGNVEIVMWNVKREEAEAGYRYRQPAGSEVADLQLAPV